MDIDSIIFVSDPFINKYYIIHHSLYVNTVRK